MVATGEQETRCREASAFAAVSEYAEADGQILLRVFANGLDERAGLNQQLVRVVIKRGVLKKLPGAALAGIKLIGNGGKLGDGVVQLLGKVFILEQLACRAAAGVQVVEKLVGLGDGLVDIVVQRFVLKQLTQVPFAA